MGRKFDSGLSLHNIASDLKFCLKKKIKITFKKPLESFLWIFLMFSYFFYYKFGQESDERNSPCMKNSQFVIFKRFSCIFLLY
jgi:hypothetical protein